jgi:hypothetical protein
MDLKELPPWSHVRLSKLGSLCPHLLESSFGDRREAFEMYP